MLKMKYKSIHIRSPKEDEDLSCFLVQTPSNEVPSTVNISDHGKSPSDKMECLIIPSPNNSASKKLSADILQTTTELGSLLAKVDNHESQVLFVNSPPRAATTVVNPFQDGIFDFNKLLNSNIVLLNQNTRTKTSEKTILLKRTSHYFMLWWKLYQSFHYNRKRIKKAIIKEWRKSMNQHGEGKDQEGENDDPRSEASDETVIDIGGGSSSFPYYPKSSIVPTPHARATPTSDNRRKPARQQGGTATNQQSHPKVIMIDVDVEDDIHSISSSLFHQISPLSTASNPSAVNPSKENIKLPQAQSKKSTTSSTKKGGPSKQPARSHELTPTATKVKRTVSRNDIAKEVALRKSKELVEFNFAKKIQPTSVVSRVRSNDSNHSHHSQKPLISTAYPNLHTINAMVALYEHQQQPHSFVEDLHENESVVSSLSSMSVLKDRGGKRRIIAGKPVSAVKNRIFSDQKAASIEEMIPSSSSPHHISLSPQRSPKFSPDIIHVNDNSSINTTTNTITTQPRSLSSMLQKSRVNHSDNASLCNIDEGTSQHGLLFDQPTVTSQKSDSIQSQQPPTFGRKLKEKLARYSTNQPSPSRFQSRYDSPEKEKIFWNEKSLSENGTDNVLAMKNRLSLIKQKISTVTSPSSNPKAHDSSSPVKAKMNPLQQVISKNSLTATIDNQQEQRDIRVFKLKILKQYFYKFRQYNTKAYFAWNLIQQSSYYYQMKIKRKFLQKLRNFRVAVSSVKLSTSFSPPPAAPTSTPPSDRKAPANLLSWKIKDSLRSHLTKLPSFRYQNDYHRYADFVKDTTTYDRPKLEEEAILEHVWGDNKLAYEYVLRKWTKRSEVTLHYYQKEMKGWNHYKMKNLKTSLILWKEWKLNQKQFELKLKQKLKKPFEDHSNYHTQLSTVEKKKQNHNYSVGSTILSPYVNENSDQDEDNIRKEQSEIPLNISEGDSFQFNDNDSIYLSDDSTHSSIVFKYHHDDEQDDKVVHKSVKFCDAKDAKSNDGKTSKTIKTEKSSDKVLSSSTVTVEERHLRKSGKKSSHEIPIFLRKTMISFFRNYQAYRFYMYSQQLKGLHNLLMNSVNHAMRNQLKEFSEDHYKRKTTMRFWNRWRTYDPASSLLSYNSTPRVSISLAPSPAYVSSVVSPSNLDDYYNVDVGAGYLTADLIDEGNPTAFLFEDTNIIIDTTSLDLSDYESYNSD
jgi:hypothetical protein